MIKVVNLSRKYGNFTAVDNVSFSTQHGEVVGLLGHNGAGKTTIMKMLTGYLEPGAGSIHIGGLDLATNIAACQAQIGYLPESLPVYPEMLVADYLHYCARMRGLAGAAAALAVRDAVAKTDLRDKALDRIDTLSRGYKQRVGVAQAILHQPGVLILDEPTNGLDPRQTAQMRQLVRQLARHATVILSTHIMQEVDAICDRVLMLRSGQLVVDQPLAELRRSQFIQLQSPASLHQLPDDLRLLCGVAPQLQSTENGVNTFQLTVPPGAQSAALCAELAQRLVSAQVPIYGLASERRDLESVLREFDGSVEVAHAAHAA